MNFKSIFHIALLCALCMTVGDGFAPMAAAAQVAHFSKDKRASHTKQMQRVFALLGKGNYTAAWAEQQKLETMMRANRSQYEDALYPLYDLSMAMFLCCPTPQNPGINTDPWKAEQLVRNIFVRNIGITEANAFLSHPDILLSTDLIKSIVEKALVKHVKEAHSLNQYHQLLSVLNESNPAYQEAYRQVEIMEFEANCGTIEDCRFYLTNYPNSPLIEQAKQKLLHLEFARAQKTNDELTWKKFISDYQFVGMAAKQVEDAKAALKRLHEQQLCNANVNLADLDAYASQQKRAVDNPVFVIYDNLINLPTHSYRFMSLKLNFNGAVGKVEEMVKESTGTTTINRYTFNAQGLLTEAYNGYSRTLTQYTYAFSNTHGFYPVKKTEKGKTYTYKCYYNAFGRLSRLTCSDGDDFHFSYDADGRIVERNEKLANGKTRVSTFKSGKIRTEKTDNTLLKFLRYDGSRATMITSEKGGKKYEWTYTYTTSDNGAWKRVDAALNGKHRMTITRDYR